MTNPGTVVLTGASSGIGAIAAAELAEAGWTVAVVGRNPERTHAIADAIGAQAHLADFDRLDDVRELAATLLDAYPAISVLANNAGGLVGKRASTVDGNERTFQHNVLAPMLLTSLLTERLEASSGRVVNTASSANRFGRISLGDLNTRRGPWFGGWRAYSAAKLETIALTRELARRTTLQAFSFHPGVVRTEFGKDTAAGRFAMRLIAPSQITPEAGAVPLVQLVANPDVDAPNGTFFDGLRPGGAVRREADDPALGAALWDACAAVLGL